MGRWEDAVRHWTKRSPALGLLAAEAARVLKGYGLVRDKALVDLWTFLDDGLPILERIEQSGGQLDAIGAQALSTLASEAGKAEACLALLRTEINKIEQTA